MTLEEKAIEAIEKRLDKNDTAHQKFRDEYIRAPHFIVTLLAVVTFISSTFGVAVGIVYNRTETNTALAVESAYQRGRILEKQEKLEKIEDMELAAALENMREELKKK